MDGPGHGRTLPAPYRQEGEWLITPSGKHSGPRVVDAGRLFVRIDGRYVLKEDGTDSSMFVDTDGSTYSIVKQTFGISGGRRRRAPIAGEPSTKKTKTASQKCIGNFKVTKAVQRTPVPGRPNMVAVYHGAPGGAVEFKLHVDGKVELSMVGVHNTAAYVADGFKYTFTLGPKDIRVYERKLN